MAARLVNPPIFAHRASAFTLVELFVVIAVIGVLMGLLLPALVYGKFRGRVTQCSNNLRQISLAAAMSAGDSLDGALPSFELPTASMTNYRSLEPFWVAFPMIEHMDSYGVKPRMWFCPMRKRWKNADEFFRWKYDGAVIANAGDFVKYFQSQGAAFAYLDTFWWVPRPLQEAPNIRYPDPELLITRIPDPWPVKMEDPSASIQPIASDWLLGSWNSTSSSVASASGAHTFDSKIRSSNAAFADGHVETRPYSAVKWQYRSQDGKAYLY
jgi:prepilin-type processing-associated H-X9-DG protein